MVSVAIWSSTEPLRSLSSTPATGSPFAVREMEVASAVDQESSKASPEPTCLGVAARWTIEG